MRANVPRCISALLLAFSGASLTIAAGPFGALVDLGALDGENGFVCRGTYAFQDTGFAVSGAGDINGDGIDDVLIGAREAFGLAADSGVTYVLFGGSGFGSIDGDVDVDELDGVNGFAINGIGVKNYAGAAVSAAGDVNGDGIGDILIGAYGAEPNGELSGESYVVYGAIGIGAGGSLDLNTLNGANGFVMRGVAEGDRTAESVASAGDVNGDGKDDVIIGAANADPNGGQSGASYVVFGGAADAADGVIDLNSLNGDNGFVCNGALGKDNSGFSVSGIGDVNNDGFDDFAIGAPLASPNGFASGKVHVVFGAQNIGAGGTIELSTLNGTNGFVCDGLEELVGCGWATSRAGDFNGDGVDDFQFSARTASPNGQFCGAVYVLFGGAGIGASGSFDLSALDGTNGFVCNGIAESDDCGRSVSFAGDFNGDGFDDVMMSAMQNYGPTEQRGETYVVFGGMVNEAGGVFELSSIDGANGVVLQGATPDESSGRSVSGAGDFNNDGITDVVIGSFGVDLPGGPGGGYGPEGARGDDPVFDRAGATYIVYGRCDAPTDLNADRAVDTADLGILIGQFGTAGPAADLNGDGVVDTADLGILIGAFGMSCP